MSPDQFTASDYNQNIDKHLACSLSGYTKLQ